MNYKIIDGKKLAQVVKDDARERVIKLKELGWTPRLVSIDVGDSAAVSLYIKNQQKAAEKVGIEFEHRHYPGSITQREMGAAIHAFNADPRVTGIILQRPVPNTLDLEELENTIHHSKDVEGMSSLNIGNIVYGDSSLGPCTSLASVELLKSTGLNLRGLEVVVVGHSEIVGKPVALLLVEDLCTVTICHHGTRNLSYHTRQADALIVAVGKPGLITANMVKPGAAVIDIGINQVDVTLPDGARGTKVVGDVDFETVKEVAGWITPVPGGVGPMTVAMLLRNTVVATERQRKRYEELVRA
ncbi:MAG TPA: bifunctional 5,10-methylenetetrahydrofolate dehydrogenase/5,10-methenyltetrahydrofolate cyclohydrolase [Anaerolineales bacterium]|nr:bifunctional 5,10-methylenetetrahydrofolate dehydrogenase/5,10-methenyltetrahydrofolate cyclohydrolase [Anaerolineales bacterium]HNQ95156.1 bifunctional 5,10-methylenetetrahydrofolate dehydrogenase/5,10-methenyltetrahydrofolate cyclohydrolase [Anaerolineales bacterium]HNS60171.1 bifunctional 5,10-methylenetetrahydrofolate dehydrogenase/5,10-methenyltetrahydrofolate cyclohydrolase [Anaerolineales bacterium]